MIIYHKRILIVLFPLVMMACTGKPSPGDTSSSSGSPNNNSTAEGKAFYTSKKCDTCHGPRGDGKNKIILANLRETTIANMPQYIERTMPFAAADPSTCRGDCALETARYILSWDPSMTPPDSWSSPGSGSSSSGSPNTPIPTSGPLVCGPQPGLIDHPRSDGGTLPAFSPLETRLRRLTVVQYSNSVGDLLGKTINAASLIGEDPTADEGFEYTDVLASDVTSGNLSIERYDTASRAIVKEAFENNAQRNALIGCNVNDTNCPRKFLEGFIEKAFRRPAQTEEVQRYLNIVDVGNKAFNSVADGLQYATAAVLQSPHFLYRAELAENGRLDAYALASRLSYFLWDSPPDQALLNTAKNGSLLTYETLTEQVDRLLASPKAQAPIRRFYTEWFGLNMLNTMTKHPDIFPNYSPELAQSMLAEIHHIVNRIVSNDEDFLSIYTTNQSAINNDLAALYGMALSGQASNTMGLTEVTLPSERKGILTTAGILSIYAGEIDTSPTQRGLFIFERLLCGKVPLPPPGVDATLPDIPDGEVQTNRERVNQHLADPSCAACHQFMDPAGLPLEGFDGIGQYRETDKGLPLDLSGDIDGNAFDGAIGLVNTLAEDIRLQDCAVRQVYRRAFGYHENVKQYGDIFRTSNHWASKGRSFKELIRQTALSQSFCSGGAAQ